MKVADVFISSIELQYTGTEATLNYTHTQSYVLYNITIARKSSYYMTTVCLPTIIVTSVCIMGLFGPFDTSGNSEERVRSLCIFVHGKRTWRTLGDTGINDSVGNDGIARCHRLGGSARRRQLSAARFVDIFLLDFAGTNPER